MGFMVFTQDGTKDEPIPVVLDEDKIYHLQMVRRQQKFYVRVENLVGQHGLRPNF